MSTFFHNDPNLSVLEEIVKRVTEKYIGIQNTPQNMMMIKNSIDREIKALIAEGKWVGQVMTLEQGTLRYEAVRVDQDLRDPSRLSVSPAWYVVTNEDNEDYEEESEC